METQFDGFISHHGRTARGDKVQRHTQVIEGNTSDGVLGVVDNVVVAVENQARHPLLTAVDSVIMQTFEMAIVL